MNIHIIANKIFIGLSSKLTKEHFTMAGHIPVGVVFSDKAKAEENEGPGKVYLDTKKGFSLNRGTRKQIRLSIRTQAIRTVSISPVYFDEDSDFNSLFEEIQEAVPYHFKEDSIVPIKKLTTKHIPTQSICVWTKVKIRVAPKTDEWRLMLTSINGVSPPIDIAEDIADGMMETVCETVNQAVVSRNVCSLIADDID